MDLSTTYAGLILKSPVIVAASSLTSKPENIMQCQKYGAGAVVLKSLYEEQISTDKKKLDSQEDMYHWYPNAVNYINTHAREQGLNKYTNLIREAKNAVEIPVIASINCATSGSWIEFVNQVQEAGADALELNIFIPPTNPEVPGLEIEKQYLDIARDVMNIARIPVTVKMGFYFSNPAYMIMEMDKAGMKGLVLFNRYFRPDIDIEKLRIVMKNVLSDPHEITLVLRWIALMSDKVKADLCGTTGIYQSADVIKHILCGAGAVQVASVLYNKGIEIIQELLSGMEQWMGEKKYNRIADFKGILTDLEENRSSFERVHFMQKSLGALV